MKYEIKAKPTYYNNRLYRSRLEARWAAFFDLSRIDFEYEPLDLYKWSPDFLIRVVRREYLVEIKPQSNWDQELMDKIAFHQEEYRCLLFHEDIIYYPNKVILGKHFLPNKHVFLRDFFLRTNPKHMLNNWMRAANKSMFLKPEL